MTSITTTSSGVHSGVRPITRGFVWANLIGQITIVFTGGWVRLTASGLGCSTWPQCEPGSFTPQFHSATSAHTFIEFGNRTVTVVLSIIGICLALAMWRERGRSREVRLLALAPLGGVLLQAVVGGITVLLHLNPAIVSVHMLISLGLVALSTLLVVRSYEGDGPARWLVDRQLRLLATLAGALVAVVVTLGVITTGAGPHSGDDNIAYRFAVDPALMARIHAAAVWALCLVQVIAGVRLWRTHANARIVRSALGFGLLTLAQGLIGYAQYFTGLPVPLVAFHLLGAALLVSAATYYLLAMRVRPPQEAPNQVA